MSRSLLIASGAGYARTCWPGWKPLRWTRTRTKATVATQSIEPWHALCRELWTSASREVWFRQNTEVNENLQWPSWSNIVSEFGRSEMCVPRDSIKPFFLEGLDYRWSVLAPKTLLFERRIRAKERVLFSRWERNRNRKSYCQFQKYLAMWLSF